MRKSNEASRRLRRLSLLLVLSCLFCWQGKAEIVFAVTEEQLERMEADMQQMMISCDSLMQSLQEQQALIAKQNLRMETLQKSLQKSEKQKKRLTAIAKTEAFVIAGFAGGAVAWYCRR